MFVRILILVAGLCVILLIQCIHGAASCSTNSYKLRDGSACYWVTFVFKNQQNSSEVCANLNGLLAVIPNQEVSDELKGWNFVVNDKLWIGVNDVGDEGVFKNSDGSPVLWTNWATGQPKDPNIPSLASQDCVYINNTFFWHDDECRAFKRALCFKKLSAITTATTTSTTTTTTTKTTTTTNVQIVGNESITTSTGYSISEIETTDTTTPVSKPNLDNSDIRADNSDKIIVPVVIVGLLLMVGAIIIVIIIVLRRKRHQHKGPKDVNNATFDQQGNTVNTENIPLENTYSDVKDGKNDIPNKDRKKVPDGQLQYLYECADVQDNTHDDERTTNSKSYDNSVKCINAKQTQKEYEEITNDSINDVIITNNRNVVNNKNFYFSLTKESIDPAENAYGDVEEGEYDLLHKKRKNPNNTADQIYSHTADDTYDTTSHGRKVDDMDDTYDSTTNGGGSVLHDNIYDSTLPGNTSTAEKKDTTYDSVIPEH